MFIFFVKVSYKMFPAHAGMIHVLEKAPVIAAFKAKLTS
jgi:hypothetical protein